MEKAKGKGSTKRKKGKIESRLLKETKCSERRELDTFSELNLNVTGNLEVCINSVLQDDLLELILVYLSIASIIRAGLVCKKWRDITTSKRFLWIASQTVSQKPWYSKFIRNSESERNGYAYDPIIQKWRRCDFLDMMESCTVDDSSDGLVCYMKDYAIYVCNPITKEQKILPEPLGSISMLRLIEFGGPFLLNISVNRRAHTYIVSILCDEENHFNSHGKLSVRKYDSATMKWTSSKTELLTGWSLGHKSVICNMVLYFLVYSPVDDSQVYGLLAYDFSSNSLSFGTQTESVIPLPCLHIYGLLNLKDRVIMVGNIDSPVDESLTLGFGIWLLEGKDWQIISRNTGHCFQYHGESFGSSGTDDLIYIHDKYDQLVVFDMNLKEWKLSQKLSMKGTFNGFCFQSRLDISPYSQSQRPRQITCLKKTVSQKPWFFMFMGNSESKPNVYAYDPILQGCIGRDFLDMMESYMFCDSSDGLVCYTKDHTIHVCNPITGEHKMLQEPPGFICLIEYGCDILINISVNRTARNYIVTVLSCDCDEVCDCGEVSSRRTLSVQVYDSATLKWTISHAEFPEGWAIGLKSIICNGVLYFLIESIGGDSKEHGLFAYNFSSNSSSHGTQTLANSIIPLPCSYICGLMNLKENLIMVGGIDSPRVWEGSIIGFSIWHLEGKDWKVISRMIDYYFEHCGDFFKSSGADDLIYIHGSFVRELVVFDMKLKQWNRCDKFPIRGGSNGFCFQPRLDISPYSQPQHDVTSSKMSLWNASQTVSQQPWFFAFNGNFESEPNGYAYDPVLQKWQVRYDLDMMTSDMFCDSSDGLVCYIKDSALHVCNPLTREHKMLPKLPGLTRLSEYSRYGYPTLVNISVNRRSHKYNVSVVTLACEEVTGYSDELSGQIYDSTTMKWASFQSEILPGWTIGCKSVICNRVLYILMDYTGDDSQKHGLVAYNFSSYSSSQTIMKSFIPLPCKRIYGLVNLKENLIVVGGIEFGVSIIGFNIWLLEGNDWHVISRITDNYFQDCCFRNYENFFGSSGAENLLYIHGHYDPGLVVFDMNLKRWKMCEKFPTAAQLDGFCFQPRLDISP